MSDLDTHYIIQKNNKRVSAFKRVADEQGELAVKIEKLGNFIVSDKYEDASVEQRHLLAIQLSAMKTYNQCLISRIAEFQKD